MMRRFHNISLACGLGFLLMTATAANTSPAPVQTPKYHDLLGSIFGLEYALTAEHINVIKWPNSSEVCHLRMHGNVHVSSVSMDLACDELVIDADADYLTAQASRNGLISFRKNGVTGNCIRIQLNLQTGETLFDGQPEFPARKPAGKVLFLANR